MEGNKKVKVEEETIVSQKEEVAKTKEEETIAPQKEEVTETREDNGVDLTKILTKGTQLVFANAMEFQLDFRTKLEKLFGLLNKTEKYGSQVNGYLYYEDSGKYTEFIDNKVEFYFVRVFNNKYYDNRECQARAYCTNLNKNGELIKSYYAKADVLIFFGPETSRDNDDYNNMNNDDYKAEVTSFLDNKIDVLRESYNAEEKEAYNEFYLKYKPYALQVVESMYELDVFDRYEFVVNTCQDYRVVAFFNDKLKTKYKDKKFIHISTDKLKEHMIPGN